MIYDTCLSGMSSNGHQNMSSNDENTDTSPSEKTSHCLKFDWNQSQIYCPLCPEVFKCLPSFMNHLGSIHNTRLSKHPYREKSILLIHTCLLCRREVRFARDSICEHLKKVHEIALPDYESRYISELTDLFQNIASCPRASRIKSESLKFEWNQCGFFCPQCKKRYSSIKAYDNHNNSRHKLSNAENPWDPRRSLTRSHKCLLCHDFIKFDRHSMTAHLFHNHSVTLLRYEQWFLAKLQTMFDTINYVNVKMWSLGSLDEMKSYRVEAIPLRADDHTYCLNEEYLIVL